MMQISYPIHDLFIRKLKPSEQDGRITLPLVSFEDHVLRRFGFAQSIRFKPERRSEMKVRSVADEVWACIDGKVLLHWWDLRLGSPSHDLRFDFLVEEPVLVLVPFGVAFGIETHAEPVHLIRFSTHPEGLHQGDHDVPWERD